MVNDYKTKDMLNVFNQGTDVDIVFTSEMKQDYLMERMMPTSLCYSAKKGGPYEITAHFAQVETCYTCWERFRLWLKRWFM